MNKRKVYNFEEEPEQNIEEAEGTDLDESESRSSFVESASSSFIEEKSSFFEDIESKRTDLNKSKSIIRPKKDQKQKPEKNEHPLITLENQERDLSLKPGNQLDLDGKFILSNPKARQEYRYSSTDYKTLDVITRTAYIDEMTAAKSQDLDYSGSPVCINVYPQKYIAVGTSLGIALIFDYGQTNVQRFGTPKEMEYGAVVCLDINEREKDDILACAYEKGHIVLWNIKNKKPHMRTIVPQDQICILSLKFWKINSMSLVVSNDVGNVYLYNFSYMIFQWTVDKVLLVDGSKEEEDAVQSVINFISRYPPGFYDIQVLKDEKKGELIEKFSLIALASMRMLLVVMVDPMVTIVYKMFRVKGMDDSIVPTVSWGMGALPALCWGYDIRLMEFFDLETEDKGARIAGYYRSKELISYMEFLSENLIMIRDSKRDFKLLYTGYFRFPDVMQIEGELDCTKAIMDSKVVDPDISFQKIGKGYEITQKNPALIYSNTIKSFDEIKRVFILGPKRMYVGKIYGWKEYIEDLILKAEWNSAFVLCIGIYQGTIRMFSDLPDNERERKQFLRPYCSELVRDYLAAIYKLNRPGDDKSKDNLWKTAILLCIDLLISVENYKYLFSTTRKWFEDHELKEQFLELLEPFILKSRVKYLTTEAFRDVVKYYTQQNKTNVIQYLIINLSLDDIDVESAILICMEFNLLSALMYLCANKKNDSDYMTPIAKSLSAYRLKVDEANTILNSNNSEVEDFDKINEEAYNYGLKFLWFVNLTLKGRIFPIGIIPDNIWRGKVIDVMTLLFDEKNLELMLEIEPHVSFEVIHVFFEPKLTNLLESVNKNSIQLIPNLKDYANINNDPKVKLNPKLISQKEASLNQLKDNVESFESHSRIPIQGQILGLVYHVASKSDAYLNLLYYMLANLNAYSNYNLPDHIIDKCIEYIFHRVGIKIWRKSYKINKFLNL